MKKYFRNPKQLIALVLMLVLLIPAAPAAFAQSFSAYVSPVDMPVYSDASMTKQIGTVPLYSVVKVLNFNGDLGAPVQISYYGNMGYALPRYMQAVEGEKATINADTRVLLSYKDSSSGVAVKAGTEVTVVLVHDGVALIERSGIGGFIDVKYLEQEGPSPEEFTGAATSKPDLSNAIPATVVVSKTGVYSGKSNKTEYLGSIKKGAEVNVIEFGDTWAYIELAGNYGYCDITALVRTADLNKATPTPAPTPKPDTSNAVPATVIVDRTGVYAGKSSSTRYLGSIKKGAQVNVIDCGDTWAYIELAGNYGYCDITALVKSSDLGNAIPATVVADKVTVYAAKSSSSTKLGVMKKGVQVDMVKYYEGTSWCLVKLAGNYGYCDVSALKATADLETATPAPTATPTPAPDTGNAVPATVIVDRTGVYAGKSSNTRYLGSIKKGAQVNVVDYGDTWAYIELAGNYGYCDITALVKSSDLGGESVPSTVIVDRLPVYAARSDSSKKLGTMMKGTQVNMVKYYDGTFWCLVELNGNYGYCDGFGLKATADLEDETPEPTATPTPAGVPSLGEPIQGMAIANVKVYAGASTSTKGLGTLKAGVTVNVLGADDTWAYIELNGNYGYCAQDKLIPLLPVEDAVQAVVSVDKLSFYAIPSVNGKYLGRLSRGAQVNVLSVLDTWLYVEFNGNYGWCLGYGLAFSDDDTPDDTDMPSLDESIPGMAIVNVKVYADASTSSKSLGTLKAGVTVNVLGADDTWAYIELNGNYGYCSASALIPLLTIEEAVKAVVYSEKLDFYAAPSTQAKHLGRLSRGAQVNVLQVMDGWAYVEYNNNYGWCLVEGLAALENAAPTPTPDPMADYKVETFTATVVTGSAKLYAKASTSAESIDAPMGANVTVTAYNSEWAYVTVGSTKGFMKISDLSRSEFATLSNGSSGTAVSTLEKALLSMGYFDELPDSTYNSATATAVKRFQATCGMTQSGSADAATQRVLYSGNAPASALLSLTYAKGSTGENVARLQTRLYYLGYLSKTSSVDGDYGNNTYNAVGLFQKYNGLDANGSANSATLKKLYSTGATPLPDGKTAGDAANIVTPSTGSQTNNSTSISSTLKSTTSTYSSSMSAAEKIEYLIYVAQNQLGKPYVYGAAGTEKYDCSGFTSYCFKQVGVSLPRTAQSQGYNSAYSRIEDVADLKRGDIVYFNTVSDSDSCDHAGIYLGAGWFIHASSGQAKVVISTLASNYYNRVFSWGHRPLG